jgi:hypothetical protein
MLGAALAVDRHVRGDRRTRSHRRRPRTRRGLCGLRVQQRPRAVDREDAAELRQRLRLGLRDRGRALSAAGPRGLGQRADPCLGDGAARAATGADLRPRVVDDVGERAHERRDLVDRLFGLRRHGGSFAAAARLRTRFGAAVGSPP